jgi:hypothetical protein
MKQVKVPVSIQEALAEASALRELARQMNSGWWFSPKALVYQMKADKIYTVSWRALKATFPAVQPHWLYDSLTGTIAEPQIPVEPKVKKPRAPRVPRASKVKDEPAAA